MTEWRPVKGYEGIYEVSNTGYVRSIDRLVVSKNGRLRNAKGCLLKPFSLNGYVLVSLASGGNGKSHKVHRLVAEAFIPNPQNNPQVNHIDGCKNNNLILNLEWVTGEQNILHAQNLGLGNTSKEVIQLKNGFEIARHESASKAAKSIGSDQSDISRACTGIYRQWKGFEWRYA